MARLSSFLLLGFVAVVAVSGCSSDAESEDQPQPTVSKDSGEPKAGTATQLSLNPDYKPK